MSMNIVALTGGIGSGKSAASEVFKSQAVSVVDLDEIAHELTANHSAVMLQIADVFGDAYVNEKGALNRSLMREKVFNETQARNQLNAIMHPAIYHAAHEQLILNQHVNYQVLSIPLLDEASRYRELISHVLVIDCDEMAQISRVMERSQLSKAMVKQIIAAQISREARNALADTIIQNDGTLDDFKQKVLNFHQNYIKTCTVSK